MVNEQLLSDLTTQNAYMESSIMPSLVNQRHWLLRIGISNAQQSFFVDSNFYSYA